MVFVTCMFVCPCVLLDLKAGNELGYVVCNKCPFGGHVFKDSGTYFSPQKIMHALFYKKKFCKKRKVCCEFFFLLSDPEDEV